MSLHTLISFPPHFFFCLFFFTYCFSASLFTCCISLFVSLPLFYLHYLLFSVFTSLFYFPVPCLLHSLNHPFSVSLFCSQCPFLLSISLFSSLHNFVLYLFIRFFFIPLLPLFPQYFLFYFLFTFSTFYIASLSCCFILFSFNISLSNYLFHFLLLCLFISFLFKPFSLCLCWCIIL